MKGRLMFAAGITTGFILGSRAGRQAYDQIKERAQSFAGNPQVQNVVGKAKDVAETRAPKVTAQVKQAAQAASETAKSKADEAAGKASDVADKAADKASDVADKAADKAGTAADKASDKVGSSSSSSGSSGSSTGTKSPSSTPRPAPTVTPTPNTVADFSAADESITPTSTI